jgi:hypothetical protein
MRRLFILPLLAVLLLAGCNRQIEGEPDSQATYDTFGAATTPEGALPLQAVMAESDRYLGNPVKVEGMVTEVCQNAGCWLTMQVEDGPLLRIDVPRDSAGVYVYTFPKDIAGRRAIVSGRLTEADNSAHEHDSEASHSEQEAEVMATTGLTLVAQGALLERVRI